MPELRLRSAANLAWLALVLSTLAAWWAGTDHGFSDGDSGRKAATVFVITVAFIKVHLVVLYFMEVRHAPAVLRWFMTGWSVIVCGGLLLMYLITA